MISRTSPSQGGGAQFEGGGLHFFEGGGRVGGRWQGPWRDVAQP
jgi:hypothetical protein